MTITATPIPNLSDNYVWHLREETTGTVAIVDPAEAAPTARAIEALGGRLDMILLTHHHADHIGGVDELRSRYGCPVIGFADDAARLPRLDRAVREGDVVAFGAASARVIFVPGHTLGHIAYFIPEGPLLACGDTLFSLGCGRLFEGTPAQMFESLAKFSGLPDETRVCCTHEYTESNLRYAEHVDSLMKAGDKNPALKIFGARVRALRAAGSPSVPSLLGDERTANPFLRAATAAEFASLRQGKDNFR